MWPFKSKNKKPSETEVAKELRELKEDVNQINKNVLDMFEIVSSEFGTFLEALSKKACERDAVDTDTMLKSVSEMYVEEYNKSRLVAEGYKQLVTSILMHVGELSLSKEIQTISFGKTFAMNVDEEGTAHLTLVSGQRRHISTHQEEAPEEGEEEN